MSSHGRRLPDPHCSGCGHAPHSPADCPGCPCTYVRPIPERPHQ